MQLWLLPDSSQLQHQKQRRKVWGSRESLLSSESKIKHGSLPHVSGSIVPTAFAAYNIYFSSKKKDLRVPQLPISSAPKLWPYFACVQKVWTARAFDPDSVTGIKAIPGQTHTVCSAAPAPAATVHSNSSFCSPWKMRYLQVITKITTL